MRKKLTRLGLLLAFTVSLAFIATTVPTARTAAPESPYRLLVPFLAADSASPAPSNSEAAKLVDELAAATTTEEREGVLYRIFDALGIGVYHSDGTAIVSGAETGATDFYLYQAEVELIASSLERNDRWSFDDLAVFLNAPGLLADDESVTGDDMQRTVAGVIDDSTSHETERAWLLPLLVYQLGLEHTPVNDLSQAADASERSLDALQRSLILTDFLLALPRSNAQVAASSSLAADTGGILQQAAVTAQGACGDFRGTEAGRNIGKFVAGFSDTAGKAIQVVTLPLDASHGASLALGVSALPLTDNLKTHYGHESPGQELDFPVRVRMLDQMTETQIDCGWLAGITYPKQGPIPNVKVDWDPEALAKHGTVSCPLDCQQTNEEGIATLRFQPKQEAAPYDGTLTSEHGRLEANVLYLSSLGNMFGPVAEAATPKLADFVWEVEWHAKGSWEGQVSLDWNQEGQVTKSTADVRFDLSLASPGEGDTHTNVYALSQGTVTWAQSVEGCAPSSKSGTSELDPGTASLTVTEADGTMTYQFVTHGGKHESYSVSCGDDPPVSIDLPVLGVLFPFPVGDTDGTEFKGGPIPAGTVITGSTTVSEDDAVVTWTWRLTKK